MWQGARPFLLLMAGVVAVALVAGVVFSRTDPRRAARLLLADVVEIEAEGEATEPPAPTSGAPAGGPSCGVRSMPVDVQEQVNALAAGVVVVQYREALLRDGILGAVGDLRDVVLVAPNEDLAEPLVATAWAHRLRLQAVNEQQLRAFVTAYEGSGPDVTACSPG